MKKIIHLMFYICIANVMWSQELHVAAGGEITVDPGEVIYVDNNVSVDAGATVTIKSDASKSASLMITGNSTGNITYKRYIPDSNWHLVSSPFTGQSIPSFVGDVGNAINKSVATDNYAVAYYKNDNTATKRWTYHNEVSTVDENKETLTNFNSGFGYSVNRTSAGDFTFTGTLETEDVQVSIPISSSGTHLWSCIGNPYPSFLPANDNANFTANVLKNNISKLDPSFAHLYVWNGTAYVPIGHTDAALQLAPGQAFMVNAKSNSETFTFSESLQNHNEDVATFHKNSNDIPTLSLNLSNGTQNKSTKIKFLKNATYGLDVGYDAGTYKDGTHSFSLDTHLVANSQGIDFTIQCLPTDALQNEVIIPLSVNTTANKELTFSVSTSNLETGLNVYLEDSVNNTLTNLTESSYQLTLKESLKGIGRFYLRTSSNSLSVEEGSFKNALNVYKTSENTLRITGLDLQSRAFITIHNITGSEVFNKQFVAQRIQDITLPRKLAAGVYMASIISNKTKYTKKLLIE